MTARRPYLDADGGLPQQREEPVLRVLPVEPPGGVLAVTRPGRRGPRVIGVYEVGPRGLRWRPAVDVQRLAERGQVVAGLGASALIAAWAARVWAARVRAQGRPRVGPVRRADRLLVRRCGRS